MFLRQAAPHLVKPLRICIPVYEGARRGRWLILHKSGIWYVWIVFMVAYGKRIPTGDHYILPVVVLVLAAALRFAAWRRARRLRPAAQPAAA